MKKIVAILAVLCLGIVIMPNISENAESTVNEYVILNAIVDDAYMQSNNPEMNYGTLNLIQIGNHTSFSLNTVIRIPTQNYSNGTVITSCYLELYRYDGWTNEQLSMNISVHPLLDNFNETEVTWNQRTDYDMWNNTGGDYDAQYDSFEIDNTTGWKQFDITTTFKDWVNNGSRNVGIMLTKYGSTNKEAFLVFRSSDYTTASYRPRLNVTYSGGLSSTITKDVWNLKGYAGKTPKLASVVYSEIANCKAIVYKNATGYYYTYAPTWGLLEDYDISFGNGLFILTTANTTWDHT